MYLELRNRLDAYVRERENWKGRGACEAELSLGRSVLGGLFQIQPRSRRLGFSIQLPNSALDVTKKSNHY